MLRHPNHRLPGEWFDRTAALPIEGAEVELVRVWAVSSNGQYPTAITDKNGEYQFVESVKPDAYLIRASAEGFLWETYTRDGRVEGQLQQIDLATQLHGIDFRLKREAIIRGVLTDDRESHVRLEFP